MFTAAGTFIDVLLERARATPEGKYVLFGDTWQTFSDVADRSERVAAGLQKRGVSLGDRVAILLPNSEEFLFTYFACNRLGAIMVPLNTFLRGSFLSHQLADSQANVVVTDRLGFEQIRLVLGDLPALREIVVVGGEVDLSGHLVPLRVTRFGDLLAETAAAELTQISPDAISGILYTSGTTGMPKGCLISHRYLVNMVSAMIEFGYFAEGDRMITAFPMFHCGGYAYALGITLLGGGSLVLEPNFSASNIIDRARENDATVLYGMGAMALAILAQPLKPDDRENKLRFAFLMPLKPEHQDAFKERFGLDSLCGECYGQTECVPVSLSLVTGARKPESAGRVLPQFSVLIADEQDNAVPVGEVGEILVRPNRPGVMYSGYWNNPAASMGTSRNLWHHTGDFGRLDDDGYLHFADRKKDAIRRRGEFISSLELEQALLKHPDISIAAVHAVPSEMTEDDIKAWIVPAEGCTIDPQGLFDYCRKVLPYYAMPRYVEVVDELPRTAGTFRVQKYELKQRPNTENTWDMEHMGLIVERSARRG